MSQSHLDQLYAALTARGWMVTERRQGEDNVRGAATWEIRRHNGGSTLFIDFEGFGGLGEDISLEESYACEVRGRRNSLYFSRVKRSRKRWLTELTEFVKSLDTPTDR